MEPEHRQRAHPPCSCDELRRLQNGPVAFSAQFQYDNRGSQEVGPHEALLVGQANAFTSYGAQLQAMFFNTFNREEVFGQIDGTAFLNSEGLKLRGYFGRGNTQPGGALTGAGFNADLQIGGLNLSYPIIRSRRLNLSVDGSIDTYDSPVETFAAAARPVRRICACCGSGAYSRLRTTSSPTCRRPTPPSSRSATV